MDSADYLFNLSSISSYRWMTECAGALSDFYYELCTCPGHSGQNKNRRAHNYISVLKVLVSSCPCLVAQSTKNECVRIPVNLS